MKYNMHPKILTSITFDGKRSIGRQCRAVRYSMVDSDNLETPNVGKDSKIDR